MAQLTLRDYSRIHSAAFHRKFGKEAIHSVFLGCMIGLLFEQFFKFKHRIGVYRSETQEMAKHALKGKMEPSLAMLLMGITALAHASDSFLSMDTAEQFVNDKQESSIYQCLAEMSVELGVLMDDIDTKDGEFSAQKIFNTTYLLAFLLGLNFKDLMCNHKF